MEGGIVMAAEHPLDALISELDELGEIHLAEKCKSHTSKEK